MNEMKHPVVNQEEWTAARQRLLKKEKELTRFRDEVNQMRLQLPWQRVEKDYTFEGPEGTVSLSDLFDGRSQLIIYHFMFGPGWTEGCSGCSFISDHVDGALPHLNGHDVSFAAVSRAPLAEFTPFKERMGWQFPWVSSNGSDFNYDFHASYHRDELDAGEVFHNYTMQKLNYEEQHGISAFFKDDDGSIYHTYSSYERGGDILINAYNFLDMAPLGRNEQSPMDWMRLHDQYEEQK